MSNASYIGRIRISWYISSEISNQFEKKCGFLLLPTDTGMVTVPDPRLKILSDISGSKELVRPGIVYKFSCL